MSYFYLLLVLQVACRPFSSAAMQAFVHVLLLPLPTLRSYVQLMQMHMVSTQLVCLSDFNLSFVFYILQNDLVCYSCVPWEDFSYSFSQQIKNRKGLTERVLVALKEEVKG